MIQRIQSLWLVLAICCIALCFIMPVAHYESMVTTTNKTLSGDLNLLPKDNPDMMEQMMNDSEIIDFSQRMSGFHSWPLALMAGAIALLSGVALFLYTNRRRQMRVVAVAFLLNVVYVFLLFFWAVDAYGAAMVRAFGAAEPSVVWHAGAYAPLASIVLLVLAHYGIKRDEAKVRAADRLR